MNTPLVSTIIPTHNRAALLPRAIESALKQGVSQHEVIVVDDDSTDETPAVAARYPVRYLRVVCGRPSGTRNMGIRAARGTYIAFLDDDDVWQANRLEPALALLAADPAIGMVYGQAQPCDAHLNPFGPPFPPLPLSEGNPVVPFLRTVIHLNTVLIRRSVLDEVGLFDEAVYGAEDMDLTVRIARRFHCAALQEPLSLVRFHSSYSNSCVQLWARWQDEVQLIRKHLSVRDLHRPGFFVRERIVAKHRGWFTHLFLEQSQSHNATAKERRTAKAYAIKTSPLHALKSPLFWHGYRSESLKNLQ
jgi:glycosyltransferase involved in cell wall biosynthesis